MEYLDLINLTIDKKLRGSYFITIQEEYLYDSIEKILEEDLVLHPDFNYSKLDMEKDSLDTMVTSLEMLPVFAEYRYVIVDGIDFSRDGLKKFEGHLEALSTYLENPNPTTILFVLNRNPKPFNGKYFKKIKENIEMVNISRLNKREFSSFVLKFFKNNNTRVKKQALPYIERESGYFDKNSEVNLYDIENELIKIRDISEGEVTIEAVDRVKLENYDDNIFNFLDYLSQKDLKNSLLYFEGFQRQDVDNHMVFYMIVRQFRNLFTVKLLNDSGIRGYEAMSKAKLSKFEYSKLERNTYFNNDDYMEIYGYLFEMEKRIKSVNPNLGEELQVLIGKICSI